MQLPKDDYCCVCDFVANFYWNPLQLNFRRYTATRTYYEPMRGTVAVTDKGWYDFLNLHPAPEVNFWTPSDRRRFSAPQFSPFFFKLKAPHRAIAGFGYFAKWSSLPPWLAWDCFGQGNGCESLAALERRLAEIRARIKYVATGLVANIGCILIVQPTFFPRDAWVDQPSDWHDRTVSSEEYDLTVGEGRRVWEECQERISIGSARTATLPQVAGLASPSRVLKIVAYLEKS